MVVDGRRPASGVVHGEVLPGRASIRRARSVRPRLPCRHRRPRQRGRRSRPRRSHSPRPRRGPTSAGAPDHHHPALRPRTSMVTMATPNTSTAPKTAHYQAKTQTPSSAAGVLERWAASRRWVRLWRVRRVWGGRHRVPAVGLWAASQTRWRHGRRPAGPPGDVVAGEQGVGVAQAPAADR